VCRTALLRSGHNQERTSPYSGGSGAKPSLFAARLSPGQCGTPWFALSCGRPFRVLPHPFRDSSPGQDIQSLGKRHHAKCRLVGGGAEKLRRILRIFPLCYDLSLPYKPADKPSSTRNYLSPFGLGKLVRIDHYGFCCPRRVPRRFLKRLAAAVQSIGKAKARFKKRLLVVVQGLGRRLNFSHSQIPVDYSLSCQDAHVHPNRLCKSRPRRVVVKTRVGCGLRNGQLNLGECFLVFWILRLTLWRHHTLGGPVQRVPEREHTLPLFVHGAVGDCERRMV
jgi:hypothetical protein